MSAKPKKAAKTAYAATPKAAPPVEERAGSSREPTPRPAFATGGAERSRLNRLAAAGWDEDRCALLGMPLDVGPRANRWRAPVRFGDEVWSALAIVILESALTPEDLEIAAELLRERGER